MEFNDSYRSIFFFVQSFAKMGREGNITFYNSGKIGEKPPEIKLQKHKWGVNQIKDPARRLDNQKSQDKAAAIL